MPDGKTHTAINLLVLCTLGAAAATTGYAVEQAAPFAVGYLIGTLLITPDLDFGGRVRVEARKNWGILGVIWYPLGRMVKHRGLTHTYLRGSTLLLIYALVMLGLLTAGLWWMLGLSGIRLPELHFEQPQISGLSVAGAWLGYLLAYSIHLWMDGIHPWNIKHW